MSSEKDPLTKGSKFEEIKIQTTEYNGTFFDRRKSTDGGNKLNSGYPQGGNQEYYDNFVIDESIQKQANAITDGLSYGISQKPIPRAKSANPSSSRGRASINFIEPVHAPELTKTEAKNKMHQEIKIDLKALMTEHRLNFTDLALKYKTQINIDKLYLSQGLSNEQYDINFNQYGPNVVEKRKKIAWYFAFIECLTNLFNLLLLSAGIVFIILYCVDPIENFQNSYIGGTMMAIAIINSAFEFYEIRKISSILDSFSDFVKSESIIIRGGISTKVLPQEIVPGDIIKLFPGCILPADAVLIHDRDLRVDMSTLNGESNIVEKKAIPNGSSFDEAYESPNVIFSTNVVVTGEGFAIVTATGSSSLVNKINILGETTTKKRSPLSKEIRDFCKANALIAVLASITFFIVAIIRGRNFNYAIVFAIGLLLAWIPVGLPLMVTLILAISGRRMLRKNVVVKDLHGIETLGAITLLATDKTGTLTKNEMRLEEVWVNCESFFFGTSADTSKKTTKNLFKVDIPGVAQILHISATCTRARFEFKDEAGSKERIFLGTPTESALLEFAAQKLKNFDVVGNLFPKVFEVPFSSDTKYHLTIHRKGHTKGGLTLHMKGAPETVWRACSYIFIDGKTEKITEESRRKFNAGLTRMCDGGQRVIAFAMALLPSEKYPDNYRFNFEKKNFPANDLTFIGLVGLSDPPKQEAADAVERIRSAGIKVIMVTGDHPSTSASISRQVNILTSQNPTKIENISHLPINLPTASQSSIIIHGTIMNDLSDEDWLHIFLHEEIIFARTLAVQKLEIVTQAQSLGHIVAVTGDGFNDSAALKRADIGIAMNKSGSDISKDSAGMILLDDNFASTVSGIYEGRLVFTNLQKAIMYTLTHIIAEAIPYMLFVVVPIPLAITATQILVIDLGFELIITSSFAHEPAEDPKKILSRGPRKPVTDAIAVYNYQMNQEKKKNNLETTFNLAQSTDGLSDSVQLLADSISPNSVSPQIRLKSRWNGRFREIRRFFSDKNYWKSFFKSVESIYKPSDEIKLVSSKILWWAYLEAGMIETCGALFVFFSVLWIEFGISPSVARQGMIVGGVYWKPHSPDLIDENGEIISGDTQYEALMQAQSAFYLSIFFIQLFNLLACKAMDRLPFHSFILKNKQTWIAVFAATITSIMIVYTPVTNTIFHTSMGLNPIYILMAMGFGLILWVYSIAKHLFILKFYPVKEYKSSYQIKKTNAI